MDFSSARSLQRLIDTYFKSIAGEWQLEELPSKIKNGAPQMQKVWIHEPAPPTISGLALHLGFDSRKAFDDYAANGLFAGVLNRGLLRIEAEYEKKLYQQASGATFALKNFGWKERETPDGGGGTPHLKIEIIESGPQPADSEKNIEL